jgi:hypothetical protein
MDKETLEEAAKKFANKEIKECDSYHDLHYGFTEGAKWQAERSYSEEEVKNIIRTFDKEFYSGIVDRNGQTNKWFEQFKKK